MLADKNKNKQATTQDKILQAARKSFINTGFAGTSINDIAKLAKTSKSLIYHHFGSKDGLWKQVKMNILQASTAPDILKQAPLDSLESFLSYVMRIRFQFYRDNPDLIKLMMWQCIEDGNKEFSLGPRRGSRIASAWTDVIRDFQNRGHIDASQDPHDILFYIMSATTSPFLMKYDGFLGGDSAAAQERYITMLVKSLAEGLKSTAARPESPKLSVVA
ncbi:MAG: TetR/AcrR family transcriptional regulator [Alphaproteobacteria bacterium]